MNKKIIILICLIILFAICFIFLVLKNRQIEKNNKESNELISENITNNVTTNTSNETQNSNDIQIEENMQLYIKINNKTLTVALEDNSSVDALLEKLKQGDIIIEMSDYANFEKVGPLGFSLPRNDKSITTTPGDIILYQGNQITIYYNTNTWNFTKLGKIENVTQKELKEILGNGDVTVTFSLNK